MQKHRTVRRQIGATPGEWIVIKSSEFSTIAVLVAVTAAVVAVQQHRERERRVPPPPAIEAEALAPSTDARLASPTGVDLVVTSRAGSLSAGGP